MFLKRISLLALMTLVLLPVTGCVLLTDFQNMEQRAITAEKINQDLRNSANNLEAEYERLKAELAQYKGMGGDKQALLDRIAELEQKLKELVSRGPGPIPNIPNPGIPGVTVTPEGALKMENSFLFDLGSWTLKSAAKPSLDQLANLLKTKYGDHKYFIDGYTDRVPIVKPETKKLCPDNWFLGFRRAHAVMTYLRDKGAISQGQLVTCSFGWLREIEQKKRSEKNRRVEIRVMKEFPTARPVTGPSSE